MGDKQDDKTLASATRWMELLFPQMEEKIGGAFCLQRLLDTTWRC